MSGEDEEPEEPPLTAVERAVCLIAESLKKKSNRKRGGAGSSGSDEALQGSHGAGALAKSSGTRVTPYIG